MHPAWTYALRDLGGSLWGTAVFAVAMFAPGYLVGRATNVCAFRTRGLREQMAWSLALSLGAGTIFLVALVWVAGVVAAGWVLAASTLIAGVMWLRAGVKADLSRKQAMACAAAFLIWTLVVVLSLVDLPHGGGLAMSVTSFDHAVRTAMVGTVMRTGVVPANPLYWPGHAAPLRYYYFWYVTCGVVARLAHITARQALIASCVWPMVAVAAMLALYGRYLLGWSGEMLRRRWWMSVALMSVTGRDSRWRHGVVVDQPGDILGGYVSLGTASCNVDGLLHAVLVVVVDGKQGSMGIRKNEVVRTCWAEFCEWIRSL